MTGFERVKTLASFKGFSVKYKHGARVEKTVDMKTAIGEVILANKDKEQLEKDYLQIRHWEKEGQFYF